MLERLKFLAWLEFLLFAQFLLLKILACSCSAGDSLSTALDFKLGLKLELGLDA
jgi:hypothetical protein